MPGTLKRTVFKNKPRQVVVEGMGKKLGTPIEPAHVIARRRKRGLAAIWVASALVLGVGVSFSIIQIRSHQARTDVAVRQARLANPSSTLQSAFEEGSITLDVYARYLGYVLVRYDSLPERFRSKRPLVHSSEVYQALASIWDRTGFSIRRELLAEIPDLPQKMRIAQDDSAGTPD